MRFRAHGGDAGRDRADGDRRAGRRRVDAGVPALSCGEPRPRPAPATASRPRAGMTTPPSGKIRHFGSDCGHPRFQQNGGEPQHFSLQDQQAEHPGDQHRDRAHDLAAVGTAGTPISIVLEAASPSARPARSRSRPGCCRRTAPAAPSPGSDGAVGDLLPRADDGHADHLGYDRAGPQDGRQEQQAADWPNAIGPTDVVGQRPIGWARMSPMPV